MVFVVAQYAEEGVAAVFVVVVGGGGGDYWGISTFTRRHNLDRGHTTGTKNPNSTPRKRTEYL